MATWNSYVLTKKGEALLASTISEGKALTITMEIGRAHV